MPHFPFEVRIMNVHNLYVADALCYRNVGEKVQEILVGLFEMGHSSISALAVLKHDLQMEHGGNFFRCVCKQGAITNEECCALMEDIVTPGY